MYMVDCPLDWLYTASASFFRMLQGWTDRDTLEVLASTWL